MKRTFLLMICAGLMLAVLPARAEPQEPAELPEKELRLSLARKMHEIRPTRLQVETALNEIAYRNVPEREREAFKTRMLAAMNIERLEQISIDAMVEVFTLAELERMVAYYLTPESRSISAKMPIFQGVIQPEIIKMLDNAMLEMRTGSGGARETP